MSKTKIQLEYPYNKDWKYGYIVINPEKRRTVILWNSSKHRSSTQYARYKLSVALGRYLLPNEHVDHIDGDKTNDDLSNLQILSQAANSRKSLCKPPLLTVCYICKKQFESRKNLSKKQREDLKKGLLCCSIKCGNIKKSETLRNKARLANIGNGTELIPS